MRMTGRRTGVAVASVALVSALAGCSSDDEQETDAVAEPAGAADVHWSYEGEVGPDHWADLSADYGLCETGTQQSPVDLPAAGVPTDDDLAITYAGIDEHVTDTGHTFQLVADGTATLSYEGAPYELVQMHYHDPSEHTVQGESAPVEFHFVNADAAGNLLVVGVLAVEGTENTAYAPFIGAIASDADEDVAGTVQLDTMLPASGAHYAYEGSLTTPPCTEGVQWIVMQEPVQLSAGQIDVLEEAYAHTSRPVQPLGDRTVATVAD
jgi:carbonic anhydrase